MPEQTISPNYNTVADAYEQSVQQADENNSARLLSIKLMVAEAYQKGEITAEEYAAIAGEPYAATMREQYTRNLDKAKAQLSVRVANGLLTPEEYQTITGEGYPE